VSGTKNARYSPGEVIEWLEMMVSTSTKSLATARAGGGSRAKSPEFRQVEEDILIVNSLGLYYCAHAGRRWSATGSIVAGYLTLEPP
jgi:hypothetical protein